MKLPVVVKHKIVTGKPYKCTLLFTLLGHACNEILALNLIYPYDKKQVINIMLRNNTRDLWKYMFLTQAIDIYF